MRRFRTTKIIKVEQLVIVIEVEQVSASEVANIDKFTRFQTFAQIAITQILDNFIVIDGQIICDIRAFTAETLRFSKN